MLDDEIRDLLRKMEEHVNRLWLLIVGPGDEPERLPEE